MTFSLTLCDTSRQVFEALLLAFNGVEVGVRHGSIVDLSEGALVMPSNSFGFMDSGDLSSTLLRVYGPGLQSAVQHQIRAHTEHAELAIGDNVWIKLRDTSYKELIVAPTKRVPMMGTVSPLDVYRATRNAIRSAGECNVSIVMPGMGTGSGNLLARVAARAMRAGYDDAINPPPFPLSWREEYERQASLMYG